MPSRRTTGTNSSKATTTATPSEDKKEYLIDCGNQKYIIEIPADWKVTYGPTSPGTKGYGAILSLRIWESDNKQRAIFTGVESFRDLSIPVKRLVKKESGVREWEADEIHRKSSEEVNIEESWKNDNEFN